MAKRLTWRIWLMLIVLILSLLALKPSFDSGVVVRSVETNSSVELAGLRQGAVVTSVNGQSVADKADYTQVVEELFASGVEQRVDLGTTNGEITYLSSTAPEITVEDVPRSRLQTGLDLRGGSRALVQADQPLTGEELDDLIAVARNRFNVFGLSDVQIRGVTDLSGNRFMLVEVAGASPDDLEELIAQQGKFEAKIGNQTVFVGGQDDIADVCRNDATCAAVTNCLPNEGAVACQYQFTLYLTEKAAQRHADVTKVIPLAADGQYLAESLFLFVDDQEVDSLLIASSLKGQVTTQISIQGSGVGATQEDAVADARESMNRMQTVLITGSLPYQLEIVKLDTISPTLGKAFTRSILLAGLAAIVLVSLIVFFRYRKFKASLALLFTAFSEVFIILGVAAFIGWNLDLPSIAGILATIGTGVDQQIVILDEASREKTLSMRQRMKRALFIIGTAYFTTVASMLPLYWAGAGLFKGFALTTIIGITAGVLVTRPAFADMIRKIEGD